MTDRELLGDPGQIEELPSELVTRSNLHLAPVDRVRNDIKVEDQATCITYGEPQLDASVDYGLADDPFDCE